MAAGDEQDLIEAVVTCEGNLHDPDFQDRFRALVDKLKTALYISKTKDPFRVRKIEPWNSVRVTISIPKEAAQKLKLLAQQGSNVLRSMGILSVQVEGDQVISLTWAAHNNEATQVILRQTSDDSAGSSGTSGVSSSSLPASSPSISSISSSVASISSPVPLTPGCSGESSGISGTLEMLASSSSAFRSPNVVAPSGEAIPILPPKASASSIRPSLGGPFPFVSMTHAAQAIQRNELNPMLNNIVISSNTTSNSNAANSTNSIASSVPSPSTSSSLLHGTCKPVQPSQSTLLPVTVSSNNVVASSSSSPSVGPSAVLRSTSVGNVVKTVNVNSESQVTRLIIENNPPPPVGLSPATQVVSNNVASLGISGNVAVSQAGPSQSLQLQLVNVPPPYPGVNTISSNHSLSSSSSSSNNILTSNVQPRHQQLALMSNVGPGATNSIPAAGPAGSTLPATMLSSSSPSGEAVIRTGMSGFSEVPSSGAPVANFSDSTSGVSSLAQPVSSPLLVNLLQNNDISSASPTSSSSSPSPVSIEAYQQQQQLLKNNPPNQPGDSLQTRLFIQQQQQLKKTKRGLSMDGASSVPKGVSSLGAPLAGSDPASTSSPLNTTEPFQFAFPLPSSENSGSPVTLNRVPATTTTIPVVSHNKHANVGGGGASDQGAAATTALLHGRTIVQGNIRILDQGSGQIRTIPLQQHQTGSPTFSTSLQSLQGKTVVTGVKSVVSHHHPHNQLSLGSEHTNAMANGPIPQPTTSSSLPLPPGGGIIPEGVLVGVGGGDQKSGGNVATVTLVQPVEHHHQHHHHPTQDVRDTASRTLLASASSSSSSAADQSRTLLPITTVKIVSKSPAKASSNVNNNNGKDSDSKTFIPPPDPRLSSQVQKLSHSNSVSAKNSSSSAASSVANVVVQTAGYNSDAKSSTSHLHPGAGRTATMVNKRSPKDRPIPSFQGPIHPSGKPRQFLINPLTGHLEPMSNESSSEGSEGSEGDALLGEGGGEGRKSNSHKGSIHRNKMGRGALLPPGIHHRQIVTTESGVTVARVIKQPIDPSAQSFFGEVDGRKTSHGKGHGSLNSDPNPGSGLASIVSVSKKPREDSTTAAALHISNQKDSKDNNPSPATVTATSVTGEKIKLRLKLEKSEPISPAYKVDVSFVKKSEKGSVLPSNSATSGSASQTSSGQQSSSAPDQPRVPPLHISLRGKKGAAVVVSPRREENKDTTSTPGNTKDPIVNNKDSSTADNLNSSLFPPPSKSHAQLANSHDGKSGGKTGSTPKRTKSRVKSFDGTALVERGFSGEKVSKSKISRPKLSKEGGSISSRSSGSVDDSQESAHLTMPVLLPAVVLPAGIESRKLEKQGVPPPPPVVVNKNVVISSDKLIPSTPPPPPPVPMPPLAPAGSKLESTESSKPGVSSSFAAVKPGDLIAEVSLPPKRVTPSSPPPPPPKLEKKTDSGPVVDEKLPVAPDIEEAKEPQQEVPVPVPVPTPSETPSSKADEEEQKHSPGLEEVAPSSMSVDTDQLPQVDQVFKGAFSTEIPHSTDVSGSDKEERNVVDKVGEHDDSQIDVSSSKDASVVNPVINLPTVSCDIKTSSESQNDSEKRDDETTELEQRGALPPQKESPPDVVPSGSEVLIPSERVAVPMDVDEESPPNIGNESNLEVVPTTSTLPPAEILTTNEGQGDPTCSDNSGLTEHQQSSENQSNHSEQITPPEIMEIETPSEESSKSNSETSDEEKSGISQVSAIEEPSTSVTEATTDESPSGTEPSSQVIEEPKTVVVEEEETKSTVLTASQDLPQVLETQQLEPSEGIRTPDTESVPVPAVVETQILPDGGNQTNVEKSKDEDESKSGTSTTENVELPGETRSDNEIQTNVERVGVGEEVDASCNMPLSPKSVATEENASITGDNTSQDTESMQVQPVPELEAATVDSLSLPSEIQPVAIEAPLPVEDSTKEEIPVKNDEADVAVTPVSNQIQVDVKMEETTEYQSEEPKDVKTMDQQKQEPIVAPESQDDSHLHPPPAIVEESQEESKEIPNSEDSSLPQKEDPIIAPENETSSGTETEKLEQPVGEVETRTEPEIKPDEPTILEKNSETITEPQEQQTPEPVAKEEAVAEAMDEAEVPDVKPEVPPESSATSEEKMDETDKQSEDINIKAIPPQLEGPVQEEAVRNEVPEHLPIANVGSMEEELPEEKIEPADPIKSEECHQEQETAKHETKCATVDTLPLEKSHDETVAPAKTEENEDEDVSSSSSTEEPSETVSDESIKLQLDSGNNNQTSTPEIPEETKEPVAVIPTQPQLPIMPQLIPVTQRPSSTKQSKDKKLLLESTDKVSTSDSTNIVVTAVATSANDPVSVTIMTPKMPEVPAPTTNNPPISIVLPSDRSGGNGEGKTSKNSYKRRAEIKPGALQNTLKRLHSVFLPKSGSDSEEGPMPTPTVQANMVVAEVDGHVEIPETIVETPPVAAAAPPPPPTLPNAVTITPNAKQPGQSFTTVTAQPPQPVNIAVSHVRSMPNVVQHPKVILPPTSAGLQSNFLANVSTALTSALSSMGSITVTSSSGGQPQTVFAIHPNMSIPANFAHLQQSPVMLPRGHKMVPIKLVTLPKQSGGQLQTIPIGNATSNRSSPNLLEAVNIVANAGSRSSSPKATLIGNAMQSSPLNLSSVSLPVGGNLHFVPISVSSATGTTGNVKVLMTQPIKMQQSGLSQSMVVKSVMMGNQPTTIRVIRPANLQEPIALHTLIKSPEQAVNAVPKQKSETPVVVIESSTRKNDFSLQQDLFKKLDGVEIVDTGSPLNNDDLPFEADIIHDEKDLADVLAAEAKTEIISMDNCTNYHVEVKTSKEITAKKGGNAVSPEINTGMSTKSIQNHVTSKKAHKINREETTTPDSPTPVMRVTSPMFTYSAKQSQDKRPTPLSPSSSPNPERPDLHGEDQEIINSFSRSPSQPRLSPQIKPRGQDGSSDGKSGGGEFLPDHTYGLNLTNCDSNSMGQELLIEIPPVDLEVAAALSPSQNQLEEKRCTRSTRSNTRLSPDITAFVSDTQKPSKLSLKTDSLSMKNSPKPSPTGSLKVLSPTPSSLTITPSTSTRSSPISHNQHQNASDAEATIDAVSLGIIHKIQGNTGGQSVKNSRLSKQPGANKRKRQESDSSSASRDENVEEKTEIDLNSRPGKRKCSENAAEMIKVCIGVEDSPKRNISTVKKTDDAKVKDSKGKKAMAAVLEDDDDVDSEVSLSRGRSGRSSRESSEDRSSSRGSSAQRVVAGDKSKSTNAKEEEQSKDAKTSRVNSRVGKEAGAKLKSQASGRVSPHPSATPAKKARESGKTPVRRPNRPNSKDKSPLTPAKTRTNVRKDITAQTPTEKTSTGGTHSGTNPENENARRKTRSSAAVDTTDSEISNVKRRRLSKDAND